MTPEPKFDIDSWNILKANLKSKFPELTDADVLYRNGTKEDLLSLIAYKLGKTRREMLALIDEF